MKFLLSFTTAVLTLIQGTPTLAFFAAVPSARISRSLSSSSPPRLGNSQLLGKAPALELVFEKYGSALDVLTEICQLSTAEDDLSTISDLVKEGWAQHASSDGVLVECVNNEEDEQILKDFVSDAIMYTKEKGGGGDSPLPNFVDNLDVAQDKLAVNVGAKILQIVPGKVFTSVDIRLCHDTEATVQRAKQMMRMYEEMGVNTTRVVMKIAGTWEGIQAAKQLEKEGILTQIAYVYSYLQAAAAAQAGCYMVSPDPGPILDWHRKKTGKIAYQPAEDPGVLLVKRVYSYLQKYKYPTICMPTAWSNPKVPNEELGLEDEILALYGLEAMEIPSFVISGLGSIERSDTEIVCDPKSAAEVCNDPDFVLNEAAYHLYWDIDNCAIENLKLAIQTQTESLEKVRESLAAHFG